MLVLHAALDDAAVLLWARRPGSDVSVSYDDLRGVVAAALGAPSPASELCTGSIRAEPTIDGVAMLRLITTDAIRLVTRIELQPDLAGVRIDRSVHVVASWIRVAAAAVVRQELLPTVARRDRGQLPRFEARWCLLLREDVRQLVVASVRSAPGSLFAAGSSGELRLPRMHVVDRFLDAIADHLARGRLVRWGADPAAPSSGSSLHERWIQALASTDPVLAGPVDVLDRFVEDVDAWQRRLRSGARSPFRLVMRLEEPDDPSAPEPVWYLRYQLQLRVDPSVQVDLASAWSPMGADRRVLADHGFHTGEHLYAPLGHAARCFEPIAESLRAGRPGGCELDTEAARTFLADASPLLERAGFGVYVPAWWRARGGRWRLGLRAQVRTQLTGGRKQVDSLNLAALVGYDWRVALGREVLSREELDRLADQKTSLVHVRGRWVQLDPEELRAALAHVDRHTADPQLGSRGQHTASIGDLLAMSVPGNVEIDGLPVEGVFGGDDVDELFARLARHDVDTDGFVVPVTLAAELRPYQQRGAAWMAAMGQWGLGACLADDMGLGKTVQTLAMVLEAWERAPSDGPVLVVCPTSVLTNWAREIERFAPTLPLLVHHGSGRAGEAKFVDAVRDQALVVTSYAVLARDADRLSDIDWRAVVLDEAQNIKNPGTKHAVAARRLRARARFALTGTPVENHVGDLWSIMEFLNPGLLGSQVQFRRKYLLPIQTGTFPEAVERLRQLTGPFILRREKTDTSVIADLPEKFERTEYCTLTTEQVGLYESIVRDAERILRGRAPDGIERRGLILATLSKLKQVCNHPAQLLGDNSQVLTGRSGKLDALDVLVERILDRGERALVFTQFVGMGELLQRHLAATFGREVLFLHGESTRRQRDAMVERFHGAEDAPPLLVLSLKAGGSGLNLTAATHVIHFDRWWNPATEQQASDRAFRIGQTRDVQVHAMVCAGTVEERIDRMLRQKSQVARSVVGDGERWITELDDAELLDLVQLRRDTLLVDTQLDDTGREWRRASL